MNTRSTAATLFAFLSLLNLQAQETPQMPQPQQEHEWLRQFVGEWETRSESAAGPGVPQMVCQGTMSARMLGGFWMISESKMEVPGMQVNALQTIGYDPEEQKYVGTWVDSMFNHLWKYEGTVDETGKILTLEAEGPNFMTGGKLTKFRDAYDFQSKDHIVVTSSMLGDDGQWVIFMTGSARRKD